ncbi:hypothetical protein [Phytomonospora endophytica]|uniref:Thymidylate kinase n=1 Tax=Phytomonospora endophytica TaxID=714109 RepID=A0A841FNM8_9ACTN|nr:hypothetical protein [Phytomonospora endophytica]MBB6035162.1 thymidylate kinase [Phytomonospora endophytica]GIG64089.1 hypothetical protein Pen01_03840 [Phytomonospora endophytica]
MTTLIAVIGGGPGVGKSTVCRALASWLGPGTDHFEEEHVLTRPVFRAVAEEFAEGTGAVRPATLIACTRAYIGESLAAQRKYLVADALVPFIPSLVAWGHDEEALTGFVGELAKAVRPADVVVVYLSDDPEVALRRAVGREDDGWIDWYTGKLARQPGTSEVHDLASAAAHLRGEAVLTRRLLARTAWDVVDVDVGGLTAGQVFDRVRCELADRGIAAPTLSR